MNKVKLLVQMRDALNAVRANIECLEQSTDWYEMADVVQDCERAMATLNRRIESESESRRKDDA